MYSKVSISHIIKKTKEVSTIKRTSDRSTIPTLNRDEKCVKEETVREIALKLQLQQAHYFLLRLYVKDIPIVTVSILPISSSHQLRCDIIN